MGYETNEGYINVVSVMQKYFDQAISGNWSHIILNTMKMVKYLYQLWHKTY